MPKRRPRRVREPIQVYLAAEERALLDRIAADEGVSRAEVLRRGLKALAQFRQEGRSPMQEFMEWARLQASDIPPDVAERHDEYLARLSLGEW